MMKLVLAGGTGLAAVAAVPLLAIFAVLGVGAGCTDAGWLARAADVPVPARPWIGATHSACPELPEPWIAAVIAQESGFDPDAHADDVNGGTRGLFQLNAAVWRAAYGAGWDADRNRDGAPDVRDPAIHARVAGAYLCARLAGVRALRAAHPDWPSTRVLSDLDALVVAHNAGESRLATYPDIPAVTTRYLREVAGRINTWSACPNVGLGVVVPGGTDPRVTSAIRTGLALVGQTGWYRRCDRLVCRAYGYANSGYPTAASHWQAMLADGYAHPGDRCPPPGAFAYWDTGEDGPEDGSGHVALVVSTDAACAPTRIRLVSNDVNDAAAGVRGGAYLVTLAELEAGFMRPERYLGWSQPACAGVLANVLATVN